MKIVKRVQMSICWIGGAGILWALGWLLFAHETPAHHPRITDSERYFIESTVGRHPYQVSLTAYLSSVPSVFYCLVYLCISSSPLQLKNIFTQ